jgi:filamentous hemagglutinin family protein
LRERRVQFFRSVAAYCAIATLSWSAPALRGQVVADGTLGVGPAGAIPRTAAGEYAITPDRGRQVGPNLFHSFSRFDLSAGERATFSGTPDTANVLVRVTGAAASSIDGTIRCTIPAADVYFINPAGVTFGPNARLDVGGSFAVATADEVRLSDGTAFRAAASPADAVLTTAAPAAFGFLASRPAALTVDGATLAVGNRKTIAIAGGEVRVGLGGQVRAPDGRVAVAAVGSPGEVTLRLPETSAPIELTAAGPRADIRLTGQAQLAADGPAGGRVQIIGGSVALDPALVSADAGKPPSSSPGTVGENRGVTVDCDELLVARDAAVEALAFSFAPASAGDVRIHAARQVTIDDGARINASTGSTVAGGGIVIGTDVLRLAGQITSVARFTGPGGDIVITADTLVEVDGGIVAADTVGGGARSRAGNVSVTTTDLRMHGGRISSGSFNSVVGTPGDAGSVTITAARDVDLAERPFGSDPGDIFGATPRGASINTSAIEPGANGGDVIVSAGRTVRLSGGSRLTAEALGGNAGDIDVRAAYQLRLSDAQITTNAGGGGGDIRIDPDFVILAGHSGLSANAKEANAGNITVRADQLLQSAESRISATSERALPGDIDITAPETDVAGGLVRLPTGLAAGSARLADSCAAHFADEFHRSSFIATGRGGTPPEPAGWLAEFPLRR